VEHKSDSAELTELKVTPPKKYVVYLLNDDVTTMDFVVQVLMTYFGHDPKGAFDIMLKVHNEGKGVCGSYPFEIAESKVQQVREFAKKNNFPLEAGFEEE
jgi:ATP-dependent Clp protease adaptor protein ClpS